GLGAAPGRPPRRGTDAATQDHVRRHAPGDPGGGGVGPRQAGRRHEGRVARGAGPDRAAPGRPVWRHLQGGDALLVGAPRTHLPPRPAARPMNHASFLAEIIANPEDDAPRLVFADWLDENGEADRADFIREQIRLDRAGPTHQDWALWSGGPRAEPVGGTARA